MSFAKGSFFVCEAVWWSGLEVENYDLDTESTTWCFKNTFGGAAGGHAEKQLRAESCTSTRNVEDCRWRWLTCLANRVQTKTTEYLDHFARFKRKENVEAVERLLSAHKELAKFERAQLGLSLHLLPSLLRVRTWY